MDVINKFPIKFRCYDQAAQSSDGYFTAPLSAVAGKQTMADLKSTFRPGTLRQGADVFHCPSPDQNDPQWWRNAEGQWVWRSQWILREDWDTTKFYPSGVVFQKHLDRDIRILDLATST